MKKLALGLLLTFAALACLLSPAMAEAEEPQTTRTLSAADRAFLASLAAMPLPQMAAAKSPGDEPPIGETALCMVSASCGDGTSVSCQGNNSTTSCTGYDRNCPDEQGHVTCDGVSTWCPQACPTTGPCGAGWCEGENDCAASCYPCDYTYTCNETYCTDFCRCKFSTCPV